MERGRLVRAGFAALAVALLAAAALLAAWLGGERSAALARRTPKASGDAAAPDAELAAPSGAELADERVALLPEEDASGRREVARSSTEAAAVADLFRGILLDEATDEPIPFAQVVVGGLEAPVGADGRWSAKWELPAHAEDVEFHDPVHGSHIRTLERGKLVADAEEGWIARIRIGPTYRVDVRGVEASGSERWTARARLVELGDEGAVWSGAWTVLRAAETPWFRYDNPWRPNAEGSVFRVDVRVFDGMRAGSSEPLDRAIGIYPEVVTVYVDRDLCSVQGRVIDTAGAPKDHAYVSLTLIGATFPGSYEPVDPMETGDDGRFAFGALVPGAYELLVRPRRGEPPHRREVVLAPGPIDLGDIVVAQQVGVGRIEGRLQSRSGRPLANLELVRLRAVDGRDFELFDSAWRGMVFSSNGLGVFRQGDGSDDVVESVFEFNEVPAGEYELSVVPRDGYAWSPARVRVRAPSDDVVFVREDAVEHARYRFRVLDAATGKELERFYVQLQKGGRFEPEAVEAGAGAVFDLPVVPFEWIVSADGYRLARGTAEDFTREGDTRVATVRLARGYAVHLVFRERDRGFGLDDEGGLVAALERPAVRDVAVRADGKLVARSSSGEALVSLSERPARIEVEAPGFDVLESERFRGGVFVGPTREIVVWMVRR